MKKYHSFYKSICGFEPYNYQNKVAEILLSNKNVILSVPTGAGKTWASIMPFLFAKQNDITEFPQKMIYSLPLRTLTNSIYSDVNEVLKANSVFNGLASIHTGEYYNDVHFESDIIFSTIDQTLSNFLSFPLSLSKRQANINAGSLIGSYLVFDEFHLLDPKLSMSTTLGILKMLGNLCRFCIMTATLSEKYISELSEVLNAEVVSIEDFPDDVLRISSLKIPEGKPCKKIIKTILGTIKADLILKEHKLKTIVICNRVEKAQQLYNEIITNEDLKIDKSNIICLHSRFFDEDRKQKEEYLKKTFGKNNTESAILISTQVVEAGMDISCDTMHVEISPINSFLQRAGRCARWEGEYGEIYVYDILELEEREKVEVETDDKEILNQLKTINNKYLPYDKTLCVKTLRQLIAIDTLDKNISQHLVDSILTAKELSDYALMKQSDYNRLKIEESWTTCDKNMYSQTIRDIQSIELAIIDYSEIGCNTFMPYKYQTISVFKWSFIKWAKDILSTNEDVIFIAESNIDSQFIDWDTLDIEGYQLKAVNDAYQLKNCYDVIFVDKSIFKYTSGAGLEKGKGRIISPLKPCYNDKKQIIEYQKDTFIQHNKAVIGCYEQVFKPKMSFTFKQLNTYWGEDIDWDKLIKAMICLHDYGKLNAEWQKSIRKFQELKGNYNPDEILAHSDFNEVTDKEIEKRSGVKYKPPHAGIGAFALINNEEKIVESDSFEDIVKPIATAILRHHGVDNISYPDFSILDKEYGQLNELMTGIGIKTTFIRNMRSGKLIDYLPSNKEEFVVYLFMVRILRLSDQKATINYKEYIN